MISSKILRFLATITITAGFATAAQAQATRTWVSGVGDDANPCSRTAPCKTFAGAISKTASGGEINVLDPGGFGAVTITKPITISSEGFEAGVLTNAGNGIVINVPNAADEVILRGLDFEGLGTGINGITVLTGGTVHVQKCTIHHFTNNGINFAPTVANSQLHVSSQTVISNNGTGSSFAGIMIKPTAGVNVAVSGVQLEKNFNGIIADGSGGSIVLNVRDCVVAGSAGNGVQATSSGQPASVVVDRSTLASNVGNGANANGAQAFLRIGNCTIMGNGTGASSTAGGAFLSFKNNQITGNGTDGTPITAVPGGPLN